jgi:hypothetical protein
MAAAEHGATFPLARKVRASLSKAQLHDFAKTSTKGLPEHVAKSTQGSPPFSKAELQQGYRRVAS